MHWFHEMSITFEQAEDGYTVPVLAGSVVDQVALYGSINRMRDLGLIRASRTLSVRTGLNPPKAR